MLATFEIERRIDVIRGQRHVVVGVGRFQTHDMEVIKILRGYPGATLISTEPDQRIGIGTSFAPVQETVVTNSGGLQLKEKRPASARVTEG